MAITVKTEKVKVELLGNTESITLEFFKIRFPKKLEYGDILVNRDFGYFDEWINRFEMGSCWAYDDYESRNAIIQLEKMGLIQLWSRD